MNQTLQMIRPFANGTQFADWSAANCDRCRKGIDNIGQPGDWPICDIESALTYAYIGDGMVAPEIARRMGRSNGYLQEYVWACTELDDGPPPPVDGRILVDSAVEDDGLVYSPWMCLLDSVAAVRVPAAETWRPYREARQVMTSVQQAGHVPVSPVGIYEAIQPKFRDAVVLATTKKEVWLDLAWWSQLYEAGMDVALSKFESGIFAVLKEGLVVGAMMGMTPVQWISGNYDVLWRVDNDWPYS